MKRSLRIFVSSPGDVKATREIAALTVERLAQDYARFFNIEPYLWEYEAMIASGHFQDSIEPPSAFDIVVLILWSRLGTRLPERTALREYRGIDGRWHTGAGTDPFTATSGGVIAISAVRVESLIRPVELRLSMVAMTLGMAYMFAAMQLTS